MTTKVPTMKRDGGEMPILGLGTWELTGEECTQAVDAALRMGYRHIDTASMYGNEEQVGNGMKASGVDRGAVFLTTKLSVENVKADGVRRSCDRSLQLLDTDYLDLLLIHWPDKNVPLAETFGAMAELKSEGKTRHVGVSNFTIKYMGRALDVSAEAIFCNQIEYHPYIKQGPIMKFCREHDVPVVAYSPLASGQVLKDETLAEIGRKHDKSPAQVALRWVLRQTGVAAVPKSTSEEHLRQNLEVFDFELDKDDLAAIGALEHDGRIIDPSWAPDWDS